MTHKILSLIIGITTFISFPLLAMEQDDIPEVGHLFKQYIGTIDLGPGPYFFTCHISRRTPEDEDMPPLDTSLLFKQSGVNYKLDNATIAECFLKQPCKNTFPMYRDGDVFYGFSINGSFYDLKTDAETVQEIKNFPNRQRLFLSSPPHHYMSPGMLIRKVWDKPEPKN